MLVDLDTAKQFLRVRHDDEDLLIYAKIAEASDLVVGFIKRPDHGWTSATVPPRIRAAVLHVLKRLYDDRDGELEGGPLPQYVKDMLWRDRDPALA